MKFSLQKIISQSIAWLKDTLWPLIFYVLLSAFSWLKNTLWPKIIAGLTNAVCWLKNTLWPEVIAWLKSAGCWLKNTLWPKVIAALANAVCWLKNTLWPKISSWLRGISWPENFSLRLLPANIYVRFLAINLAVLIITGPLVVIYGPFTNIKRSVVGAIMTSRHPQWITWLLSEQEVKGIIGEYNPTHIRQQALKFTKREDESLKLVNITGGRFKGYLLEIPDPSRVKTATARDIQEIGDTVSTIALNNNAIAAINAGGFYDPEGTGTGRLPYGVIIRDGKLLVGADIKDSIDVVGMTKSGMLVAGNHTIEEMRKLNIAEGVTFGPPLILNGKKLITQGDGGWGIAPRTAIGQRKDGSILFLVIDGRQPGYSIGATLLDVQNILFEQGAFTAVNLDGGSSTTLFYNGKVVNKPADMLGERMVPTAFIVK